MIFYSLQEILLIAAAAIAIDWIIGDPRWPTHPVIRIGRLIRMLEKLLRRKEEGRSALHIKGTGTVLAAVTLALSFCIMWGLTAAAAWIHPWLGYAVSAWYISTTIAVKGLKDAAMLVYRPLAADNMEDARKYVGYIVGRDTAHLTPAEASRAAVETVAENTVDAFVSPILFAIIGGAPLAMLYRAANTLDSMVGYRNDNYVNFGWCSARTDDVLNYVPARFAGLLLTAASFLGKGMSAARAWKSVCRFARRHPSPNSGIPESAVAGALGIELGGLNYYFGQPSERARMGWPLRTVEPYDIVRSVRLLYMVSILMMAGVLAVWLCLL